MPNYHRFYDGGAYFFTIVTFNRLPILTSEAARKILHSAWLDVCRRMPFETVAVSLLPEHMHCVWSLPQNDQNYSLRWREIKRPFTKGYLEEIGPGESRNSSRLKRGEAAIWQRRFWEHSIRDQDDLNRHIDYFHYNPVKHGIVKRVMDWPWSSFHRFVKMGLYEPDWGPAEDKFTGTLFGE